MLKFKHFSIINSVADPSLESSINRWLEEQQIEGTIEIKQVVSIDNGVGVFYEVIGTHDFCKVIRKNAQDKK